jgi:hypothetical protein
MLGAWERRRRWDKSRGADELRLVTVICDDDLHPAYIYLLTLALQGGWITEGSRQDAVSFIINESRWGGGNEKQRAAWIATLNTHLQDLPQKFGCQLAAALDVPLSEVIQAPLAVGGPLPVSLQMGISVDALLRYIDPADVLAG